MDSLLVFSFLLLVNLLCPSQLCLCHLLYKMFHPSFICVFFQFAWQDFLTHLPNLLNPYSNYFLFSFQRFFQNSQSFFRHLKHLINCLEVTMLFVNIQPILFDSNKNLIYQFFYREFSQLHIIFLYLSLLFMRLLTLKIKEQSRKLKFLIYFQSIQPIPLKSLVILEFILNKCSIISLHMK